MLQIVQTTIPTFAQHVLWPLFTGFRLREHLKEMLILVLAVGRFVEDLEFAEIASIAVGSDQRDQSDFLHRPRSRSPKGNTCLRLCQL